MSVSRGRTVLATPGPTILPEFLAIENQNESSVEHESTESVVDVGQDEWRELGNCVEHVLSDSHGDAYRRSLVHFDRLIIAQAMKVSNGLQSKAAELLGLSRPTLRAKLRASISDGSPPKQP